MFCKIIFFFALSLSLILSGCQTSETSKESIQSISEGPAKPVNVAPEEAKPATISEEEQKDIREYLETFYGGNESQWEEARQKLLNMGPNGVEALCLFMVKFFAGGKKKISPKARTEDIAEYWKKARKELVRLQEKSVPYLVYAMSHPKIGTSGRMQCSITLVEIGKPAVSELVKNLENGNRGFRRMVLETLANIGDTSVVPAIISAYKNLPLPSPSEKTDTEEIDPSFDLRLYSVRALGKLKAKEGIPVIEQALDDSNDMVVKEAMTAIPLFPIPEALPALQKALSKATGSYAGFKKRIELAIYKAESSQ